MSASSQRYSEYPSQRIAELLEELCPEGVPITKLGEVAEIGTGRSDRKDADPFGEYPFYVRSQEVLRLSSYEFDETAIIIPGEGKVGEVFHFQKGKYALHQRAYRVHITDPRLEPRFVFFHFHSKFGDFIGSRAVNGTVKSLRKPMLLDFPIPLPPLDVQREIVAILDSFTDLDASLQREKQLRQQQTKHYQDALLNFGAVSKGEYPSQHIDGLCLDEVSNVPIDDLVTVGKKNSTPAAMDSDLVSLYSLPAFDQGRSPEITSPMTIKSSKRVIEGPVLLIPKLNPHKPRVWQVENPTPNSYASTEYFLLYPQTGRVNLTFLKYSVTVGLPSLLHHVNKGSNSHRRLPLENYLSLEIPLPSLDVQGEIVAILDDFTAMEESVSKEIDLRNQQLEYYRDQLLTFPTA